MTQHMWYSYSSYWRLWPSTSFGAKFKKCTNQWSDAEQWSTAYTVAQTGYSTILIFPTHLFKCDQIWFGFNAQKWAMSKLFMTTWWELTFKAEHRCINMSILNYSSTINFVRISILTRDWGAETLAGKAKFKSLFVSWEDQRYQGLGQTWEAQPLQYALHSVPTTPAKKNKAFLFGKSWKASQTVLPTSKHSGISQAPPRGNNMFVSMLCVAVRKLSDLQVLSPERRKVRISWTWIQTPNVSGNVKQMPFFYEINNEFFKQQQQQQIW